MRGRWSSARPRSIMRKITAAASHPLTSMKTSSGTATPATRATRSAVNSAIRICGRRRLTMATRPSSDDEVSREAGRVGEAVVLAVTATDDPKRLYDTRLERSNAKRRPTGATGAPGAVGETARWGPVALSAHQTPPFKDLAASVAGPSKPL